MMVALIISVNMKKAALQCMCMCCSTPEPIPRMMSSVSLQKQDSDASFSIRGQHVHFLSLQNGKYLNDPACDLFSISKSRSLQLIHQLGRHQRER